MAGTVHYSYHRKAPSVLDDDSKLDSTMVRFFARRYMHSAVHHANEAVEFAQYAQMGEAEESFYLAAEFALRSTYTITRVHHDQLEDEAVSEAATFALEAMQAIESSMDKIEEFRLLYTVS